MAGTPFQSGRNTGFDSPVRNRFTPNLFASLTEYLIKPDPPTDNTMIREFIERLKTWAKQTAAALKERLTPAIRTDQAHAASHRRYSEVIEKRSRKLLST
jgi:hypothetical protein